MFSCRGHPLVGVNLLIREKRRSLYLLPSYEQRLLALPYQSWTATQKPYACICNENIQPMISQEIIADAGITYPRASIVALSLTLI